jgi:hypothetical protein
LIVSFVCVMHIYLVEWPFFFLMFLVTSAEKSLRGQTTENATRNRTTTRSPVPFVVNILIEGKTCSVTRLCTKDLKWWRDLHPLDHPIVLQSNHEVTVPSLPTVRPLNLIYYQKTRRPVSYMADEVALLRKLFPTFVTHVLLKRYNRNIRYVWVKSSIFLIPVLRFDRLFCLCDAYIFSGMAPSLVCVFLVSCI